MDASGAGMGKQVNGRRMDGADRQSEAYRRRRGRGQRREEKVELAEAGFWATVKRVKRVERETKPFCAVLEPPDLKIQFCATRSSCAVYRRSVALAGSTG